MSASGIFFACAVVLFLLICYMLWWMGALNSDSKHDESQWDFIGPEAGMMLVCKCGEISPPFFTFTGMEKWWFIEHRKLTMSDYAEYLADA